MTGSAPPVGALIFISIKPLVKLVLPTLAAFVLARRGLFDVAGSRAGAQLILNVTLPALLFSKIVPSFSQSNISALLPIVICALSYIGISLVFGVVIRAVFPVPRNFRYGILAAAGWSNWGDLPTSVVVTVTSSAPFGGTDSDLAIAYVAIFILVFFVTLFPLQGTRLISRDYTYPSIDEEDEEKDEKLDEGTDSEKVGLRRPIERFRSWPWTKGKEPPRTTSALPALQRVVTSRSIGIASIREVVSTGAAAVVEDTSMHNRRLIEGRPSATTKEELIGKMSAVRVFFLSLFSPPTIALICALVIALVPKLKSLFIRDPASTFAPTAPDSLPPLSIILDTATFVGNASVPLGLFVLGAALARMKLVRPLRKLPLRSIGALAVAKLVVLPFIGHFLVEGLRKAGLVQDDNYVLRFVLVYFSAVPTATTQVALTQIYAPVDGISNSDVLAAYLIAQYCLFVFSSVVLTAVSLRSIIP